MYIYISEETKKEAAHALLSLSQEYESSNDDTTSMIHQDIYITSESSDYVIPHNLQDIDIQVHRSIETQTDYTLSDICSIEQECQNLRNENIKLKEDITRMSMDENSMKNNDRKVKLMTGLGKICETRKF